jgi:hypothetical protein
MSEEGLVESLVWANSPTPGKDVMNGGSASSVGCEK